MGVPFGAGQRLLFDACANFSRAGRKAFLRVKNFDEENPNDGTSTDYMEVGVPFAPTGTAAVDVGTTDIPILPQPAVVEMSQHNIGMSGGKYMMGAKIFTISHTFVKQQLIQIQKTDDTTIWRDRDGRKAVGIFYDGTLYSIEAINHKEMGGETINWKISCNCPETESQ